MNKGKINDKFELVFYEHQVIVDENLQWIQLNVIDLHYYHEIENEINTFDCLELIVRSKIK